MRFCFPVLLLNSRGQEEESQGLTFYTWSGSRSRLGGFWIVARPLYQVCLLYPASKIVPLINPKSISVHTRASTQWVVPMYPRGQVHRWWGMGRQPYRPAQKKPGPSMLGLPRCRGEFQGKGQMRRRAIEQKVEARKGRRAEILEGCGIHFSLFIKQSVGRSDLVSK